MRKEIGSEFWSIPTTNAERGIFADDTGWFMSGRSALEAIIVHAMDSSGAKVAHLPSWCCDSMIIPFVKHGLEVRFYPVYMRNGELVQEIPECEAGELLLVMDYFGYSSEYSADGQKATVIRDLTHTVFSNDRHDADYYFGSLRKWCGFKTGGFAIGIGKQLMPTAEKYVALRSRAMEAKAGYMQGEREDKGYLNSFAEAEEYLDHSPVAGALPCEIELANKIDVELIRNRRRQNAAILMEAFPEHLIFDRLSDRDCPLFVPIVLDPTVRDGLRKHLISREIYLPIHWPISSYHKLDGNTRDIYEREISLVCDQRYGQEDMYRMVNAINDYFKR